MTGYPGTAILEELGEGGDKLAVMGTHGRSGVKRWVLGSVADRVIRHSSGPVLVVRPGQTSGGRRQIEAPPWGRRRVR
jgi:nucleotide-binding universal stress UspA family protein